MEIMCGIAGPELLCGGLAMLVEKAVDYEKTSYRGLFHFLRYTISFRNMKWISGGGTTGEMANVLFSAS